MYMICTYHIISWLSILYFSKFTIWWCAYRCREEIITMYQECKMWKGENRAGMWFGEVESQMFEETISTWYADEWWGVQEFGDWSWRV